jgi:hypothetical protein
MTRAGLRSPVSSPEEACCVILISVSSSNASAPV